MKVRIFDETDDPEEMAFRCEADLRECYPGPKNLDAYQHAFRNIRRNGCHYEGGGAMPLTLLVGDSEA